MPFIHATRETKPRPKHTIVQALDEIARHGGGYATVTHHAVYLRHPLMLDGKLATRVLPCSLRDGLGQVIGAGVPTFDLRPLGDNLEPWIKLPLVCVPPHTPATPPYGSDDFAPVSVVAEMARELGVIVVNV